MMLLIWWKDKVCRPNQRRRRSCRKRGKHAKIGSKAAPKISEDISSSSTTTSADEIVKLLSISQFDTESSLDSSDSEVSSNDLHEGWDEWLRPLVFYVRMPTWSSPCMVHDGLPGLL